MTKTAQELKSEFDRIMNSLYDSAMDETLTAEMEKL